MRFLCRSKIQGATVTQAESEQSGCIVVDEDLMDRADLYPGEKVLVASHTTGQRLETYIVGGARGSGLVALNGAAAQKIKAGEVVDVLGFETSNEVIDLMIVCVDKNNKYARML
ncbi:MAG: aspartate 1-decarboxylase [Verrucomicrobia bacterium]|nr:aspartate 1-decarboxylase [Verrucomicrobiota bacterium]